MIYFIHPNRYCHTDRSYLAQWFFDDILIITDVDVNQEPDLRSLVENHHCKRWVLDFSHNVMTLDRRPQWLADQITLTTEWVDWYRPRGSNIHYFPLWLWMFSLRTNQWYGPTVFDAAGRKNQPMMCLNRNPHPHRLRFGQLIESIRTRIVYTLGDQTLPGEEAESHSGMAPLDVSVAHPVYSECAVNIVTETMLTVPTLSEKTCKPFIARQIPIIVGPPGCNRFLTDIGLDMFEDIIPWHTWDGQEDHDTRMQQIAGFVIEWLSGGKVLDDYQRVIDRVERNKQYFHSDQFRQVILKQMFAADPYSAVGR